jgi:hypothetical protein
MKRPPRSTPGEVPPERGVRTPPKPRRIATIPKGDPISQTPQSRPTRVPEARTPPLRRVANPPNPRKPKLVRDAVVLNDLFALFPDLPRPRRPVRKRRRR